MKSFYLIIFAIVLLFLVSCDNPVEPPKPEQPPDTALIPTEITVTYASFFTLRIHWSDTTKNKIGFILERSINSTLFTRLVLVDDSLSEIIDTIKEYGYYQYKVSTITKDDTSKPKYSSSINIIDPAPSNVVINRASPSLLQLNWINHVPLNHKFLIDRDIDSSGFVFFAQKDSGVSYLIDTIKGYHTYRYRISAVRQMDSTRKTLSSYYSVNDPLPAQVHADYFDQEYLQISWNDDIPFETGFVIERSINDSQFDTWMLIGANTTSVRDTAKVIGSRKYRIYAVADGTQSNKIPSNELLISKWLPGRPYESPNGFYWAQQLDDGDILLFDKSITQRYNIDLREWKKKGDMFANAYSGIPIKLKNGSILSLTSGIGMETPGGISSFINEVFDPSLETWRTITKLKTDVSGWPTFTPVLLTDGSVFITGSVGDNQSTPAHYSAFAEIFNAAAESFSLAVPSTQPLIGNTASSLSNRKVIVAGGIIAKDMQNQIFSDSCYLYDPQLDSWTATGRLSQARAHHWAVTMNYGTKVFVMGGRLDYMGTAIIACEAYDVNSKSWQSMASLPVPYVYTMVKVDEDTLYAILGSFYNATSFYRFVLSSNSWKYISSFPSESMTLPNSIFRLSNGRFIVTGNGNTSPYFYLPDLK